MIPANPWLRIGLDAWALGLEASTVVALRAVKIAAGGAAGEAECRRMVEEKLQAGLALQAMAMSGGLGMTAHDAASRSVAHYQRLVRANRRRLTGA